MIDIAHYRRLVSAWWKEVPASRLYLSALTVRDLEHTDARLLNPFQGR